MKTKIKFKLKINILARTAVLFLVLFLTAIDSDAVLAADPYYKNPQITTAKMFNLTNQSREEDGLSVLVVNQKLTDAAEAKANDMFKHQYFDHNSPSGVTPWDWIKGAEYGYRYAGENLAIDFITAEGAHKSLMASDSHRENILNRNYTEIGIAVKEDIFEESNSIIIVMEFGSPLKTKVADASNVVNENIKLSDNVKSDSDIAKNVNINSARKELRKEVVDSQLPPDLLNLKKYNEQDVKENVRKQGDKKTVHLNNENNKNNYKTENAAHNAMAIGFAGMSVDDIEKNALEKVYTENIYWESHSKRNINRQTTVMSSGEQSKSNFSPSIFYLCVLSILFIFESLYLFSNFMIGKKFRMESIRSGELDVF